jgi:acyl-CoA dehydrogenase
MAIAVDRDQAFLESIRRIADEVAAPNADAVDREARFPQQTLDALRAEGALAALVPTEHGGLGLPFETVAAAAFELGRRCGASGMVFAMHQIQVATLLRHADDAPWFQAYLGDLAREQRLVASVTSEIGTGGDLGRSIAAVTPAADGRATFEKQAPTVSYGAYADDLLTTLRRDPDAEPGDQVLALTRRDQTTLEQVGTWDPMGMRGTCSPGFTVRAEFPTDQILPTPFSTVAPESMVPITHVLWSHLWLGIATDAFDRARAFVKASAKGRPETAQPMAMRLSHLMSELALLRAEVGSGLRDYLEIADTDRERLTTMATILRFNNLKLAASEQAPRICQGALGVAGIVGFKNDTPFSVGRHIRDTMSASLMIANERIHQTNASLLLIAKDV